MKAAVHTSYGPPDVVRIAEVEKPAAKDNQVLYGNEYRFGLELILDGLDRARSRAG
ncbi:MAG TPA: hypothetical protein VFJ69_16025 [Actinomycetota bacterium]|nr:hypothetical protein [Actinomycetota bacterium]